MRKISVALVLLLSFSSTAWATDPKEFVHEYIRGVGRLEAIRDEGIADSALSPNKGGEKFAGCIRTATKMQLELRSQIAFFSAAKLEGQLADLGNSIAAFYGEKLGLWTQMGDLCSALIAGPRPNVDYGKIAGEAPKITAGLDFIDHALFGATPLVFAALIDEKPDAQNHLSHLVITKAQRDELTREIQYDFGKKLDASNQNYMVNSIWVLREYLTKKGYKCSDEP